MLLYHIGIDWFFILFAMFQISKEHNLQKTELFFDQGWSYPCLFFSLWVWIRILIIYGIKLLGHPYSYFFSSVVIGSGSGQSQSESATLFQSICMTNNQTSCRKNLKTYWLMWIREYKYFDNVSFTSLVLMIIHFSVFSHVDFVEYLYFIGDISRRE